MLLIFNPANLIYLQRIEVLSIVTIAVLIYWILETVI